MATRVSEGSHLVGRVFCSFPEASVTGFFLAAEKLGEVRDVCLGLWATAFSFNHVRRSVVVSLELVNVM